MSFQCLAKLLLALLSIASVQASAEDKNSFGLGLSGNVDASAKAGGQIGLIYFNGKDYWAWGGLYHGVEWSAKDSVSRTWDIRSSFTYFYGGTAALGFKENSGGAHPFFRLGLGIGLANLYFEIANRSTIGLNFDFPVSVFDID